jgi:hypothetical protein
VECPTDKLLKSNWIYKYIVIWDLNNFILEKEELLNQLAFWKLHIGHNTRMQGAKWLCYRISAMKRYASMVTGLLLIQSLAG